MNVRAIGIAAFALLASHPMPLSVNARVLNDFTVKRQVSVSVRSRPHARCTLTDALTGQQVRRTTSSAGRATWRWQPSVWADAIDTITVRCAAGSTRRSVSTPLLLRPLPQISVLRDYAVHLVYWAPAGAAIPPDVAPAVSQLEADVKASLDAGATDNPFAVPRAYGDSLGSDDPRIASIDSTVDTDPFPKAAAGYCQAVSTPCIGDPNLAREVERLARQHGWIPGNHTLVMIYTPPSVVVCNRFSGKDCTSDTQACGFHDISPIGYVYADMLMSTCLGASRSVAEYAIAVTTHEQVEAVVDPLTTGLEVADPCEGQFSPVAINGHTYDLPAIELPTTKCAFGYTP